MTTARVHNIDTIFVLLQNIPWSSTDFVDDYSTHVEGVLYLEVFPRNLTLSAVDVLVGKLVSRQ